MPHDTVKMSNRHIQPQSALHRVVKQHAVIFVASNRPSGKTLSGVEIKVILGRAELDNRSFFDTDTYSRECIKSANDIEALSVRWKTNLTNPAVAADVDSISETIDAIYEVIGQFGPGAINLRSTLDGQINAAHLASILRATFQIRSDISGWNTARDKAKQLLPLAGIDVNDALAGLLS